MRQGSRIPGLKCTDAHAAKTNEQKKFHSKQILGVTYIRNCGLEFSTTEAGSVFFQATNAFWKIQTCLLAY